MLHKTLTGKYRYSLLFLTIYLFAVCAIDPAGSTTENGQSSMPTVNLLSVKQDILKGYRESEKSSGKTVVAVVGDTGCGKSTFLNCMAGCKMQLIKRDEIYRKLKVSNSHGFMASVVVDVAEDSPIPPVASVGHLGQSQTAIPELVQLDGLFFWDTPGYLDSRGVDFRISNAVNLRQVFYKAREVKIVVLAEFASFQAGRGDGVRNLVNTLCKVFGDQYVLKNYLDNIIVVVTKVGRPTEDLQLPLEQLQSDFASFMEREFASLKPLSKRLVLFDPLDRDDRQYTPIIKREALLQEIRNMKSIKNPSEVFLTSFNAEELNDLLDAEDKLMETVLTELEAGNIAEASKYFQVMKVLQSIIRNDKVNERINKVRNILSKIMEEMNGWITQLTPHQQQVLEKIDNVFAEDRLFDEDELEALEAEGKKIDDFEKQFTKEVKIVFAAMLITTVAVAAKSSAIVTYGYYIVRLFI